jgi:hypothetical protein
MIRLPYLREIVLPKGEKEQYQSYLSKVDNRVSPYLINLLNFDEIEYAFLEKIELYLKKKCKSFTLPYPIYLLTNIKQYSGSLHLINHRKDIPSFYLENNVSLMKNHQKLAKLNSIAEKKFDFIDFESFQQSMVQYRDATLKIHLLRQELKALDSALALVEEDKK